MPNDYQLYDFQRDGVDWLKSSRVEPTYGYTCKPFYGLIGDEMGLGKTAQALDTLRELIETGKRILFLVPGATVIQWQKNFDRWILDNEPDEFGVTSLIAVRGSKQPIPAGCHVVLSHALIAKHEVVEKLAEANFDGIVIDEIHKFGSVATKRIKHLWALINLSESKLDACRIGLSGTPVRNYAKEIYNIAHFLEFPPARTQERFAMEYLTWDKKALSNAPKFHRDFAPFYIRRTVLQVQKSLPSIRRTKLYTEITDPFVRAAYNHQIDLMSNYMNNAGKIEAFSLLGYLVKMRHLTGFAKAREESILEPILEYLRTPRDEGGGSIVIGLHHKLVRDRLAKSLSPKGEFPIFDIRGGMTDSEKEREKQAFIATSQKQNAICLLSIKAAAEGIDGLQYASRKLYVFERQWNGADEHQLEKRIHRTGQIGMCEIEYTMAIGTVDEFFDDMVEMKFAFTGQVEDKNYTSNPQFMKQLAERVCANRLPEVSAAELREAQEQFANIL